MLHKRAHLLDPKISIATVYRTVRLFEEAGIIEKARFRRRHARAMSRWAKTIMTISSIIKSGKVIEFTNAEIEKLQHMVAEKLGYKLVEHRLELYCMPLASKS